MKPLLFTLAGVLASAGLLRADEPNWEETRRFWSFQPVRKSEPPAVKNASWARGPIDRFVLAKLEQKGIEPVAPADRYALIRRATFDLTGLPPTPEEVEAFINDRSSDAFAKVIDRLLASPAYGEHQARQWLDVARYAEDQAHTFGVKPNTNAWRYRDWVIDSFNADLPYDRFAKLQIAADLLDDGTPAAAKNRAALGFFGLGAQYYKSSNPAKAIAEELDDKLDTLTRGFLGLTIACARCHDHKFDPIPTADYYSLAGVFASSRISDLPLASKEETERYAKAQQALQAAEKKTKDVLQAERDKLVAAKAEELQKYFVAAWKLEVRRLVNPNVTPADVAKAEEIDAGALDRMNKFLNRKGQAAADGWLKNMPKKGDPADPPADVIKAAEQFRDLVKAAASAKDKAKADMVASLFGDKGVMPISDAEAIAHMSPECKQQYEALKAEQQKVAKSMPPAPAAAHGLTEAAPTDMKIAMRGDPLKPGNVVPRRFLRVITGPDPEPFKKGSGRLELAEAIASKDNPLTARVMVNRIWQQHFGRGIVGTPSNFGELGERPTHPELLDYLASTFVENGWSLKKLHRDAMLSAVYQLSSGPGSSKAIAEDADNRLLWKMSRQRLTVEEFRDALLSVSGRLDSSMGGPTANLDDPNNVRRTVYGKVSRHELNGLLRMFDFPDANITADRRTETTVPQQQLFVLNSEAMVAQAKAFTARLHKEAGDDPARIRRAYLLAFARPASDDEVDIGRRYLAARETPEQAASAKLTRWERYCQALLASNEFLYLD